MLHNSICVTVLSGRVEAVPESCSDSAESHEPLTRQQTRETCQCGVTRSIHGCQGSSEQCSGAVTVPACNTPCEDGLQSTPVKTGGDSGGPPGLPQTPEEIKVLVGLFKGSCHVFSPLEVKTECDPQ